ncbi:MAG: RNA polymerase sigma factor [Candidatus Polarisedimenticolia bacterium]
MTDPEQVVRDSQPFVRRVAYHFLRNRDDAADVAQDVLMRLHQQLPSLPSGTNLNAWLYRVTANLSINFRRDSARRARRDDESARSRRATVEAAEPAGFARALAEAIDGLPPQQRGVVTLRLMEERTFAEIARIFGVTDGTVKVQFARGMRRLKESLHAWR